MAGHNFLHFGKFWPYFMHKNWCSSRNYICTQRQNILCQYFFSKISIIMFARSLPISQSQFSKHRSQDSSRGVVLQPGQISSQSFPPSKHLKRRKAASALWRLDLPLVMLSPNPRRRRVDAMPSSLQEANWNHKGTSKKCKDIFSVN